MPSIGTYHRSDRILNCRIGATNRWGFQPWKVFDFPLENSGMDIPRPHSSLPTTLPHPLFLQPGTATAAPPAVQEGSARADPQPCTPVGPAGREYKNTGLLTELNQEQQAEAARSSSLVLSSSPAYCLQHCLERNNIVFDYC